MIAILARTAKPPGAFASEDAPLPVAADIVAAYLKGERSGLWFGRRTWRLSALPGFPLRCGGWPTVKIACLAPLVALR
jgi:hypothetical protein